MNRSFYSLSALILTLIFSACTSKHTVAPPQASNFQVLRSASGAIGVSAQPGSADAGTTVSISAGGTGSGTAADDGSVAFHGSATTATVTVSYTKAHQALTREAVVQLASDHVTKPLFSTGSAPNDMEFDGATLDVVNSLDNTLVSYQLDGTARHTFSFPVGASPSYLGLDPNGDSLAVVRNGDNLVSAFLVDTLAATGIDNTLTDPTAAFIGPGKPALWTHYIFVPRAQIESFAPTVYGPGKVEQIDRNDSANNRQLTASGKDVVSVAVLPATSSAPPTLFVLSAGDLQFDQDFHPHVDSDSFLDIFTSDNAQDTFTLAQTIDLGAIGAASMAVRDGQLRQDPSSHYSVYLGNLLSGDVYKVDLKAQPPLVSRIHLTDEFTYVPDLEFIPSADNMLVATSFNTDELYVIDTNTDTVSPAPYPGPFDLKLDPGLLAGASAVEVLGGSADTAPPRAYVLYGVANAVARVDLLP